MSFRPGRGAGVAILLTVLLAVEAMPASGQYFGRQKVQYETFDWRILDTERFEIHFYPATETMSQDAARMAERWYSRLSRAFQHEFERKPLIFYADHPDFQQTNTTWGMLTEGTGGFTESLRNRVVMPYTGVHGDTDHVLGHELVHVFQYDLAQSAGGGGLQGMGRLPLWLIEGMAEYLSLGREDAHTAMWMRDAALRGELPTIRQLTRDTRFFPYRYGQALWAYVAGRWGDRAVPEVYRFATRSGFEAALERVLGVTHEQLSEDWITATRAMYLPLIEGRQRPQDAGERILYESEPGAMNLSPAVSPDGRFVAFYGRRDIFTVDLYVADAVTGEIVQRLTSPNRDQHFDALSFIASAGTWSPDGSQFAFVVFADGDHQISIMDIASRRVTRRYSVTGVGAVQSPSWSPDGSRIAFSGMAGGLSDLYVLDLGDGTVRQLTDDRYADLHPTWSPDGRTLAFVSDRVGSDMDRLIFGEMRIGLMDAATGTIRMLDLFPNGKHINPQFSPDGNDLYFIADPLGFSDLYRIELATGQLYQVTNLATGISGITKLSPAMSIASRTGRMMFSVFENSGTNVYALEMDNARGQPVERTAPGVASAAVLPPAEAQGAGLVYEYLQDPDRGLPAETQFATRAYRSRLGLDFIGPPSFGVGVSEFGAGVAGGVSFFFSDMLGDNQIGAVVQANGSFRDIGGQAQYVNMARRWNWGGVVGHIPYLRGYQQFVGDPFTGTGYLQQRLQRIYVQQAAGLLQYPFSQTRRVEGQAGFTRYAFHDEVLEYGYFGGRPTGEIIQREIESLDPLNFFVASAAYVGDNSFFGFTSPVAGQRFRFEASPTFGTMTFHTLLGDYRRYVMAQPFTFAFRGLHYGRYGKDADGRLEDGTPIMSDLFLGHEPLVRGYSWGSFEQRECVTATVGGCPALERLFGSRLAVANFEIRIPLFGVSEYGLINFPYLPTEISPFFDAGLAWFGDDAPDLRFDRRTEDRVPVFSTGLSARVNVLGYLVLEAYYAYPFQRPEKGWHWGLQIAPGW
ncbi:MAG TPA: basic secretory protein-like protein [Longimicrobiales bacterium]|nr:basic secretory protein-like protein [Longimicrobiales bacterium]